MSDVSDTMSSIISGNEKTDPKLVEEYQKVYLESIKKYGPRTAILMQCGTFFELYDCCKDMEDDYFEDDEETDEERPVITNNMHYIADLLNIVVVKNSNRDISLGNPHKAGFGVGVKDKFFKMLLDADFNIVVLEETPNTDKKIKRTKNRKITQVLTPGVCEDVPNYHANNVLVIYIENKNPKQYLRRIDKYELEIGLAALDVTTNESFVYELSSVRNEYVTMSKSLEEVFRFLQSNRCRELIIHLNCFKMAENVIDVTDEDVEKERERLVKFFTQTLELDRYHVQHIGVNDVNINYTAQKYQNRALKNFYGSDITRIGTSATSFVNLENRIYGCCAMLILLEFIKLRNGTLISKLAKPVWWDAQNELVLSHNAIEQLDLIQRSHTMQRQGVQQKFRSLFDIINHTATAMGKRLLEQHIVHPLIDHRIIEERYQIVDEIKTVHLYNESNESTESTKGTDPKKSESSSNSNLSSKKIKINTVIGKIRKQLRSIGDIQRLCRKIELRKISPSEFGMLIESLKHTIELMDYFKKCEEQFSCVNKYLMLSGDDIAQLKDSYTVLSKTFNQDILAKFNSASNINENVFNKGINSELDDLFEELGVGDQAITVLAKRCNNILEPPSSSVVVKGVKKLKQETKNIVTVKDPKGGGKHFIVPSRYRGMLKFYQDEISDQYRTIQKKPSSNNLKDIDIYKQLKVRKYNGLIDFVKYNHATVRDRALIDFIEKNKTKIGIGEINSDEDEGGEGGEKRVKIEYLSPKENEFIHHIQYGELKSGAKIFTPTIATEESRTEEYLVQFSQLSKKIFEDTTQTFYEKYENILHKSKIFVANLDVLVSHSITSIRYNYNRPCVVGGEGGEGGEGGDNNKAPSYIRVKGIRHPIIERIQTDIEYKKNDLNIGKKDDKDKEANGIFLFGSNNGGKSSMLKAVGLNIVLAQMGCFVAADSFEYRPFHNIITRLSGNDNLWKAQGVFAVEMSELRTVMNQSDINTMVLGDEICHGTEQKSALAIVGASAIRLCQRKTNFIFSTHLRLLPDIQRVKDLDNLKFSHFVAIPDSKTEEIIYHYKLEDGVGQNMYGVEIAESMGVEKEMCTIAYELRKQIEEKIVIQEADKRFNVKKSNYNSNVYLGECAIEGCKDQSVDTHHIRHQSTANNLGQIDHFHKNVEHNLIGLCKNHHQQVHDNEIDIIGYVMTSNGPKLDVHFRGS